MSKLTAEVIAQDLLSLTDVAQGVISHAQELTQVAFEHGAVNLPRVVVKVPRGVIQGNVHFRDACFLVLVAVVVRAVATVVAKGRYSRVDGPVLGAEQHGPVSIPC